VKHDELNSEFGQRIDEDRTDIARSRFTSANPLPPPPMPFFPSNIQWPSHPRSLMANVFSFPDIIHPYSSSTALVYRSHPRPMSGFALLRKKSRPRPEDQRRPCRMCLPRVTIAAIAVSSNRYRRHLPRPSVLAMPSLPATMASGSMTTTTPPTHENWRDGFQSHRECQEVGYEEAEGN